MRPNSRAGLAAPKAGFCNNLMVNLGNFEGKSSHYRKGYFMLLLRKFWKTRTFLLKLSHSSLSSLQTD